MHFSTEGYLKHPGFWTSHSPYTPSWPVGFNIFVQLYSGYTTQRPLHNWSPPPSVVLSVGFWQLLWRASLWFAFYSKEPPSLSHTFFPRTTGIQWVWKSSPLRPFLLQSCLGEWLRPLKIAWQPGFSLCPSHSPPFLSEMRVSWEPSPTEFQNSYLLRVSFLGIPTKS